MSGSAYGEYCKPKLEELLASLKLNHTYVKARGDYLVQDNGTRVLDFVGGFGATILGHNHPRLKKVLIDALENDIPIHTQGAIRAEAAELAKRLSALASNRSRYYTNFSNSGTESVEAALKHAYKKQFDKIRREYERISRVLENFYVHLNNSSELSFEIPNDKSLNAFRDDLDEYNLGQFDKFQKSPHIIAFNGSFHGKSTSSLKITFNKTFREAFEGLSSLRPHFINPDNPRRIREVIDEQCCNFYYPLLQNGKIEIRTFSITCVIAVILETVRGEGGIRPLPVEAMEYLAANYKKNNVPVIIDEIQTGCCRLGSFFSYHQTPLKAINPDYIVLSKALGGGLCKIGATLIREDIFDQDFSILHTSTFGEDALSARIANSFIDIVSEDNFALCSRVTERGRYIRQELEKLQREFPGLILDIRGSGLMFAVEFSDLSTCSPFFRATGKQGVLSLLISSYLHAYHHLRVMAPLTTMLKGNPGKKRTSIIRIQPSANITDKDIDTLTDALREVLRIIQCNNEYLLVYHLIGDKLSDRLRTNPASHPALRPVRDEERPIDSRTGFIVHPTGVDDLVEYYFPSFKGQVWDRGALTGWWNRISRFLEPVHCRSDYITSNGFVIENSIVFIPYLPEQINNPENTPLIKQEIRDKVQDAVTIARELGDDNIPVTMVGLGAYTSIITRNATDINDYEVPVTTGNAYTTALVVQGIFRECAERNIDIAEADVAIIGANGNIGMVLSRILTLYAGHLLLVGSASDTSLTRLRTTRRRCYEELFRMVAQGNRDTMGGLAQKTLSWLQEQSVSIPGLSAVYAALQSGNADYAEPAQRFDTIAESHDFRVMSVSTSLDDIQSADIVIIATNSADPELITPPMVKKGAILCCASMPSNICPLFDSLQDTYGAFDGGLATLPENSSIDFVGMPGNGMAFGCLSETLLLGLEGQNHSFCKGELTTDQVYKTIELAEQHHFKLGELTLHNNSITPS